MMSMKKGQHIFGTVKVGEKGQIVIPKEARQIFDIKAGDTLLVLGDEAQGIAIVKADVMKDLAVKILKNGHRLVSLLHRQFTPFFSNLPFVYYTSIHKSFGLLYKTEIWRNISLFPAAAAAALAAIWLISTAPHIPFNPRPR